MNEEKEPESYSSFWTAAMDALRKKKKEREENAVRKTLATQQRINELQETAERGQRAKQFIDSEFWKRDVEPFLRSEAILKPWVPRSEDQAPSERSYIDYLVGSGQVRVLTRLLQKFEVWQVEGEEAEKSLQADFEKRRALTS